MNMINELLYTLDVFNLLKFLTFLDIFRNYAPYLVVIAAIIMTH